MDEDIDVVVIARALMRRFGAEAIDVGESRAEAHRCAEEQEGAELWQRVTGVARMILTRQGGTLPPRPS
jgi:hypothetical protein